MAAVLPLVLGVSCGGQAPAPPTPSAARAEAPVAPAPAVTPDPAAPPASPATPAVVEPAAPPEPSDTRALVVLEGGKLVRLAPSGATELVREVPDAGGCDIDDELHVLWLVSRTSVAAYDLVDGKVHTVATWSPSAETEPELAWQVQYFDPGSPWPRATAGNADGLDDCVALGITIGPTPKVGGTIVAQGDREWYCIDNADDAPEGDERRLNPEASALRAVYDRAALVDSAYLVALDTRRKTMAKRSAPELVAPPAPKLEIDPARCDEVPEDCGKATYLGGSRLWSVITNNSRGDFYHESRQLFDSKEGEYWNLADGQRSATPADDGDEFLSLWVSPDGSWGIHGAERVSLVDAEVTGTFEGMFCGWQ